MVEKKIYLYYYVIVQSLCIFSGTIWSIICHLAIIYGPDIIVKASETAYYVYDEKMQTKAQFSFCVIINNIITFQEKIDIEDYCWATFITFETED